MCLTVGLRELSENLGPKTLWIGAWARISLGPVKPELAS
jgi:hypothetical protein